MSDVFAWAATPYAKADSLGQVMHSAVTLTLALSLSQWQSKQI